MFHSLVIISYFCLVPVPLQMIYVLIETKEMSTKAIDCKADTTGKTFRDTNMTRTDKA